MLAVARRRTNTHRQLRSSETAAVLRSGAPRIVVLPHASAT